MVGAIYERHNLIRRSVSGNLTAAKAFLIRTITNDDSSLARDQPHLNTLLPRRIVPTCLCISYIGEDRNARLLLFWRNPGKVTEDAAVKKCVSYKNIEQPCQKQPAPNREVSHRVV